MSHHTVHSVLRAGNPTKIQRKIMRKYLLSSKEHSPTLFKLKLYIGYVIQLQVGFSADLYPRGPVRITSKMFITLQRDPVRTNSY